ncbi:MAG: hypothetical protein DWQ53_09935 [Microcystis flos-aquae DF17]|nr:MAG: hypothetical protein DWQ53_09935 [Microcystis flos-aquae DF17]
MAALDHGAEACLVGAAVGRDPHHGAVAGDRGGVDGRVQFGRRRRLAAIQQARQAAAGQGDGGKGNEGEAGGAHGDLPDETLT